MTKQEVINLFYPGAKKAAEKYKYPVSVLLAQAILESGWFKSSLATKYKNLTGMKIGSGKGNFYGKVTYKTQEYKNGQYITITDTFRTYKDLAQSFDDLAQRHKRFNIPGGLSSRQMINEIVASGYATAPNYKDVLTTIIKDNNLDNFQEVSSNKKILGAVLIGGGLLLLLLNK
jgi:lysozyme